MSSFLAAFIKLNELYHLVDAGQKVILAVSGGTDSLCMARTLWEYRKSIDPTLDIRAVYIRIPEVTLSEKEILAVEIFLSKFDIPITTLPGKIGQDVTFECYSCARERRKQIFIFAAEQHISTVAFGHNLDDYLETGFMNLVHGGYLESMLPKQTMFNGEFAVIRPLLSVRKKHINSYAKSNQIPRLSIQCSFASIDRRELIRSTMIHLQKLNRAFIPNLRNAINCWNGLVV